MKNSTKVIAAIVALVTGIVQLPIVQESVVAFLAAHPTVSSLVVGIASVLALIHKPNPTE